MAMKQRDRVGIFVDGGNMFYAQRTLGWHLDFGRVLQYFARGRDLFNAFYYTGVPTPVEPAQRDFLTVLRHLGCTVRMKPMKEPGGPSNTTLNRKANLEIEIVVDMFNTASRYDVAVLMSGDGEFTRAVELLRSNGKEIIGVGAGGMIAAELENACDRYVKLDNIRHEVEKIRVMPGDVPLVTPQSAMAGALSEPTSFREPSRETAD